MNLHDAIQQRNFKSKRQKAIINILYTSSWLSYLQNGVFKKFGLSMQQFNVLRILRGQHPGSASVNSLISRMIDQSSNVSRIVDKLYTKGFVLRTTCPEDRRQVDVKITSQGLDLLKMASDALDSSQEELNSLSDKEYDTLNDLLDKLRMNKSSIIN